MKLMVRPDGDPAHRADPLTSTPNIALAPTGRIRSLGRMNTQAVAESATLLEREHELERVRAAVRAVGRRAGAVTVIEGPAGIGKSRLLAHARERATELGISTLDARATELEQGFPYGVVRQLFERRVLEAEPRERERWFVGAAGRAAEVLTAAPMPVASEPAAGPAAPDPGYAWAHGLYWLASNISVESPLLLIVDDLQWCDAPSARALSFIARRLEGLPLGLLLATRPLDPALTPEAAMLATDPGDRAAATVAADAGRDRGPDLRTPVRSARPAVRARVHRGDRRQSVPARRAARRGGRPWTGPDRGRRGRRRRDRPARRREHGAAAAGADGSGGRRARSRAQRARRRRAGRGRGRARAARRPRTRGRDVVACVGGGDRARRHDPLHAPDPARGDLRGSVGGRAGATSLRRLEAARGARRARPDWSPHT